MDRLVVNEDETDISEPEPITLEIEDGVVGGSSIFTEGD
jgi:hypothetical protein